VQSAVHECYVKNEQERSGPKVFDERFQTIDDPRGFSATLVANLSTVKSPIASTTRVRRRTRIASKRLLEAAVCTT